MAISYDCQAVSRDGSQAAAESLRGVANTIKVVDLGLGEKEDLTDWFVTYRRSRADLWALIEHTNRWTP